MRCRTNASIRAAATSGTAKSTNATEEGCKVRHRTGASAGRGGRRAHGSRCPTTIGVHHKSGLADHKAPNLQLMGLVLRV